MQPFHVPRIALSHCSRSFAAGAQYRRDSVLAPGDSRSLTRHLWLWSRRGHQHHEASGTIYHQLDSARREIRVLCIQPGADDADISCDLDTVSLNRRPSHDTLSYTWGSSKTTFPIEINGTAVQISPNLFEALKSIRQARKTVTLWADALCIDQNNVEEKNSQVAMMDHIYKRGRQTWISLGSPDQEWATGTWMPGPKLEESMHIIKRLVRGTWRLFWHHVVLRRSRASRLGVNHVSDSVRLLKSLESKGELSAQKNGDRNIAQSMLAWLVTHHYWERVWILQEIALSGKDPICMFGKHQIPLLSLDTVIRDWRGGWDGKDGSRNVIRGWLPEFTRGFGRIVEVCLLRDEYRRRHQLDLVRCLQLTSHRYTTLAHDHVYGLYSLLLPHLRVTTPDYGLSVRQLYASITKNIIRDNQTAEVLCASVGIGCVNQHRLPSWALDVSMPVPFPAKHDSGAYRDDLGQADDTSVETLSLLGRPLDDEVVAVMDRKLIDRATFEKLGLANVNKDHQAASEQTIEDIVSQCYRVALEAGLQPDLKSFTQLMTSKVYEVDTDQRFENLQEDALHQRLGPRIGEPSSATATKSPERDAQQMPIAMFHVLSSFFAQEMGLRARNHNFFCTRQGRIGECAGEVAVGDELWLLSNAKTAFLLRPAGEEADPDMSEQRRPRYRLVGPCKCSGTTNEEQMAAAQVFAIPEILEMMLEIADPVQLFAIQRVNRTFKDTIADSKSIRRRMSLDTTVGLDHDGINNILINTKVTRAIAPFKIKICERNTFQNRSP